MEYKIFHFTKEQVKERSSTIPDEENDVIVETAGFIPLDVRFKQLEQNGVIAKLREEDFSLSIADLRQIYFGEDTEIHQYDEIEDVEEKLIKQAYIRKQLYDDYQKQLEQNQTSSNNKNNSNNKNDKNEDVIDEVKK